ncbi:hypothetical protein [Halalkalibacter oceani]|uniref:hypothetical protein n=1 Tax=Halalkalibacter oceani TaxID=1653776 RepID=UPI003397AA24
MKKKFLMTTAAAVLSLGLLAACGGAEEDPALDQPGGVEDPADAPTDAPELDAPTEDPGMDEPMEEEPTLEDDPAEDGAEEAPLEDEPVDELEEEPAS